jgi:hypothetical protein
MTDGHSASLSWNKAHIWGLRPDFYYSQTVTCLLMWSALSYEKTVLSFTIAAGLASAVILGSESHGTRGHILLSPIRDFLFVASYDSQGYGGDIRPHQHSRSSHIAPEPQRTPLATYLLLLHDVTANVTRSTAACVRAIASQRVYMLQYAYIACMYVYGRVLVFAFACIC